MKDFKNKPFLSVLQNKVLSMAREREVRSQNEKIGKVISQITRYAS